MKRTIPITTDPNQLDELLLVVRSLIDGDVAHEIILQPVPKKKQKRTLSQNASIFKYYRIIAKKLNDAGFTTRTFFSHLKDGFEIDVTMENIRSVAEKVSMDMFEKPVKKLDTKEIQNLHKVIDKGCSLSMGVSHRFPSDTPPMI